MKVYNEIYPAEKWAEKINKYLLKVAEEKPNMYAKTKYRYLRLANSLLDSVSLISVILEEELLLSEDSNEFNELSAKTIKDTKQISSQLQNIENSIEMRTKSPDSYTDENFQKQDTIKFFDSVFEEASKINFGYAEVNECANLLYQWFHSRFAPTIPDPSFKFNIDYLELWIANFIILYGKYNSLHQNGKLVYIITNWCNNIGTKEVGNFAIPYPVYQIDRAHDPADFTFDAVIINEILTRQCLYKLSRYENTNLMVNYDVDTLVMLVRTRNPSLRSKILVRVAQCDDFAKEIGLTPIGGVILDE